MLLKTRWEGRCLLCLHVIKELLNTVPSIKPDPREGDITMCPHCGVICLFDGNLNLRQATEKELDGIRRILPQAYALMKVAGEVIQQKRKNN